jgi:hypothetical protein
MNGFNVAGLEIVSDGLEKTGSREDVAGRRVDQHHHVTHRSLFYGEPHNSQIFLMSTLCQMRHEDSVKRYIWLLHISIGSIFFPADLQRVYQP